MSRRYTSRPAPARWAAMPLPITPAPPPSKWRVTYEHGVRVERGEPGSRLVPPRGDPGAKPTRSREPVTIETSPRPGGRILDWHDGASGHSVARVERNASRAPMLIYFRVDWCPY